MLRKKLKASFTIEAGVVVPILMIIIVAMITIAFLLHDRLIMSTAGTYEVMEHAGDFDQQQEAALQNLQSVLDRKLITADNVTVSGESRSEGIRMRASGEADIPLSDVSRLVGAGSEKISVSINITNLKGRKALIRYKTYMDALSFMKDGQEEKESG